MNRGLVLALGAGLFLGGVTATKADSIMHMGSAHFVSDLEPVAQINVPSFDNQGGALTLINVLVEIFHSASVEMSADNDDPFQGTTVRGRLTRIWSLTGPGVVSGGNFLAFTPFVNLLPDDNDGGSPLIFDRTPPDGIDFGTFGYSLALASSHSPAVGLYSTNGPNIVSFFASPDLLSQDVQFQGNAPDAWQLEVQNPQLDVKVKVTYEYVPEPSTLSLLGLGGIALVRRRVRRPIIAG